MIKNKLDGKTFVEKEKKNETNKENESPNQYNYEVFRYFFQVILNILYNNNPIVDYVLDIDEILVSIGILLH
jgi:hypothetical protein